LGLGQGASTCRLMPTYLHPVLPCLPGRVWFSSVKIIGAEKREGVNAALDEEQSELRPRALYGAQALTMIGIME